MLPKLGACRISGLTEHELRAVVTRGANRTAVIIRNNLTQLCQSIDRRSDSKSALVATQWSVQMPSAKNVDVIKLRLAQ